MPWEICCIKAHCYEEQNSSATSKWKRKEIKQEKTALRENNYPLSFINKCEGLLSISPGHHQLTYQLMATNAFLFSKALPHLKTRRHSSGAQTTQDCQQFDHAIKRPECRPMQTFLGSSKYDDFHYATKHAKMQEKNRMRPSPVSMKVNLIRNTRAGMHQ